MVWDKIYSGFRSYGVRKVEAGAEFRVPDYTLIHFGEQSSDRFESLVEIAEHEAQKNLTLWENRLLDRGIKVNAYFRVGCPFDEIVQMANQLRVDLIIIGSHGCTGLRHLLPGSTAERVVEHAKCPVLVVKES